ncbi:hypothetical protein RC55_08895 [Herbaspirillum seropedicae]|nr:hypothetical protein ACP92_01375 [Herbaspirillum seropedicae]NQE29370.1 hypothetical protein [Herbaspirillum seropedicae]
MTVALHWSVAWPPRCGKSIRKRVRFCSKSSFAMPYACWNSARPGGSSATFRCWRSASRS